MFKYLTNRTLVIQYINTNIYLQGAGIQQRGKGKLIGEDMKLVGKTRKGKNLVDEVGVKDRKLIV